MIDWPDPSLRAAAEQRGSLLAGAKVVGGGDQSLAAATWRHNTSTEADG